MDAKELLKTWPEWVKANAARVLASPAWRLDVRYDGQPAVLRRLSGEVVSPAISLVVRFDDVPRLVTFAPSPLFPDLWTLRDRLSALPGEVLLALVEKECGALFQLFEDVSRRTFSIQGLSDGPAPGAAFALTAEGGEITCAVELSSEMEQVLGQLSNLDVTHESIRSLTREVSATCAVLEMSDAEIRALGPGDCLAVPPDAAATWELDVPADGAVRLVASETRVATFGEIADGTLGPVPEPGKVDVVVGGRILATGTFARLGEARIVRIADVRHGT